MATAPSRAQAVSANWGASRSSSPGIHEMPVSLVTSQPPTATAFATMTAHAAGVTGRSSAHRPAPSCATATTTNRRASSGCSAWMPVAAAWMAPAPSEAIAATARPGKRRDKGGLR